MAVGAALIIASGGCGVSYIAYGLFGLGVVTTVSNVVSEIVGLFGPQGAARLPVQVWSGGREVLPARVGWHGVPGGHLHGAYRTLDEASRSSGVEAANFVVAVLAFAFWNAILNSLATSNS